MPDIEKRLTAAKTVHGDEALCLHSLTGCEALSEPFRFSVQLVTQDTKPIDPATLLGTVVKVTLDQETTAMPVEHPKRYFNGFVTQVSRKVLSSSGKWLYTVELRPWLWLLEKTKNCRIFQEKTVPEIVEQVLRDRGFTDFKFQVGKHEKREYCVQYRESDLDFVSRLLEHEGIYYYFEFDADKHTLVLTDGTTDHQPKPTYETIECSPIGTTGPTVESMGGRIHEWCSMLHLRAEHYVLKDYDFIKPKAKLEGTANGKEQLKETRLEMFDYPGGFTEAAVGSRYAALRMLEEQAPAEVGDGETISHGVAPGYVFTMAENKDPAQNRQYLTIRATYDIAVSPYEATTELQPRPWRCAFSAIPASTKFRPARVTPRPVIAGLQTAKVVGTGSEEIHTDVYGRVKVQFHWDREGKSSCFLRTAQTWAGASWGSQFIPRVGHEVVVSFLEGDPDHPLVVGSVYNGLNQPAFPVPAQKEVSGVKSKSTLDGGTGYNELSFDDTKDKEVINLRAQHNMRTVVRNERYTEIGRDDTEVVKGTQHTAVGKQFVTVKETYSLDSKLSAELVCGPTVLKLTPLGIAITAPKIEIDAPIFSLDSANAVILPGVFTVPLGPRPWVSGPPPIPAPAPALGDRVGGKRAAASPPGPASKPDLAIDTGMPSNGMPTPPGSPV